MRNAGVEEAQAGIKIARRNIHNLRYADDTTLMAESEEELKSLLMKVKVESEKVALKLNIQKMIQPSRKSFFKRNQTQSVEEEKTWREGPGNKGMVAGFKGSWPSSMTPRKMRRASLRCIISPKVSPHTAPKAVMQALTISLE